MQVYAIVLIIIGIWLLGLTAVLIWILKIFNSLTANSKGETLIKILEKVLLGIKRESVEIDKVKKQIESVRSADKFHIQKIGVVRFNPFRETGGDHSFSIAFLDETDTGVILTGIHTRERTRIYTKALKNGKGEFELSDEEKKALSKAQKK